MMSVKVEGLGPVRSVLAAVGGPDVDRKAALAMAESYTTDILDWIAEGQAFTPRHGSAGLEGAISWRPDGDGAAVYTSREYARYVEEGTGVHAGHPPWVIRPKAGRKALKIPSQAGGYVLRRSVTHTGAKPKPYFFADWDGREAGLLAAARSVIAAQAAGALDHG
jgi:hypothetical protein